MTQPNQKTRAFCEMVYETIASVPKGKVTTYKDIAQVIGYPGYARQVAKCLSTLAQRNDSNKYKGLPWHRVMRSNMKLAFPPASPPYNLQMQKLQDDGVIPKVIKASNSADSAPSFPSKYRYQFIFTIN